MPKPDVIDTTGFTPLERHVTGRLQADSFLLALEAERTTDGTLCLTTWSERHQVNLMFFVVETVATPTELDALYWRCNAHRAGRTARDVVQLVETSDLSEAEARALAEEDFAYQMGLYCRGPMPEDVLTAYLEDDRWEWKPRTVQASLLEGDQI